MALPKLYTCSIVPNQANDNDRVCWVYVVCHLQNEEQVGPVKVGISHDPFQRIATLQTGCPHPIDLAYIFEFPNREMARAVEASFHACQKDRKLRGEWFNHHPVQAITLLCLSIRIMLDVQGISGDLKDKILNYCGVKTFETKLAGKS